MISRFVKSEAKGVAVYTAFLVFVAFLIIRLRDTHFFYGIDRGVMEYMVTLRTDILTTLMERITFFGDGIFIIPATLLFSAYLWMKKERGGAALLFFSVAFMGLATKILKLVFARVRPFEFSIIAESGFSFPSGHTLLSLVFYGIFVYILTRYIQKKYQKVLLFFTGGVFILLIGISRIYLGVHWPTDVFASYLFGGAWLWITLSAFEKNKKEQMPE